MLMLLNSKIMNNPNKLNKFTPNIADTLKNAIAQIDQIENKLLVLTDQITHLKNDIIRIDNNQEDIDFRLT